MSDHQQQTFGHSGTQTVGGDSIASSHTAGVARTAEQRIAFLKRVYGWMFGGVVATAAGAALALETGIASSLLGAGVFAQIGLIIAWVFGATLVQRVRHRETLNVVAFFAYGIFTGIIFSSTLLVATILATNNGYGANAYILQAFGLTVFTFGGLSIYALTTKRDFSFMRGMLQVGIFVLLGLIVLSLFTESSALHMALSAFGVLLFAGYTLYDTQKILRTFPDNEHVAAGLTLFVDFVLLFIYILNLLMSFGRE